MKRFTRSLLRHLGYDLVRYKKTIHWQKACPILATRNGLSSVTFNPSP
jgi:hypothetical protein